MRVIRRVRSFLGHPTYYNAPQLFVNFAMRSTLAQLFFDFIIFFKNTGPPPFLLIFREPEIEKSRLNYLRGTIRNNWLLHESQ